MVVDVFRAIVDLWPLRRHHRRRRVLDDGFLNNLSSYGSTAKKAIFYSSTLEPVG
jgi:hypothetical protein